jgi:hypothetical protein
MNPCFQTFISISNNHPVILHSTICKHGQMQKHFQGGQPEKLPTKLHLIDWRVYFCGLPTTVGSALLYLLVLIIRNFLKVGNERHWPIKCR